MKCLVCAVARFIAARVDKPIGYTRDEREVENMPNAPRRRKTAKTRVPQLVYGLRFDDKRILER